MKQSQCTSYEDIPLFLNAHLLSEVLGVSISTAYGDARARLPSAACGRNGGPQKKFIQWAASWNRSLGRS